VPEIVPGPRAPQSERLRNGFRYISSCCSAGTPTSSSKSIASLDLSAGVDASETYAIIDRELPKLDEAWYLTRGLLVARGNNHGALPMILAKGAQPTQQHKAEIAGLLAGTKDVESYDIAAGIDRIISALFDTTDHGSITFSLSTCNRRPTSCGMKQVLQCDTNTACISNATAIAATAR